MAEHTAALMRQIGVEQADVFGYSLGAAIALRLTVEHPNLVRKLVVAALAFSRDGLHPGLLAGMDTLQPEHLADSPFQEEYAAIAPNPDDWPTLIAKIKDLNRNVAEWSPATVQGIKAPTLIVIGDSDIVRPEHAVELFRLRGGGVPGDMTGLPPPNSPSCPARPTSPLSSRPRGWYR